MKRYGHGLVLGKFYPPHAGHHHLVRTARDRCERLTVLVCAASVESVPLTDRVAWMREIHPDVTVVGAVDDTHMDVNDPAVWDAHMAVFRAAVPERVDAVFTSEAYGEELGRRFGAASVLVDPDRTLFPISGTAVREDRRLLGLPPAARTGRPRPPRRRPRRGVHRHHHPRPGARRHYRARGGVWARTGYVAEYGREYSEDKLADLRGRWPGAAWEDVTFTTDDFPLIARTQNERERPPPGPDPRCCSATPTPSPPPSGTSGTSAAAPLVEETADRVGHHLWLLTDHEGVAFEDDGLRDGEELRPWMTDRFRAELTRTGRRFIEMTGPPETRLAAAVAAVDGLLATGWDFAAPLPEKR